MRHWKLVLGFVLLCVGGVVAGFLLDRKAKSDQVETAKKNLKQLARGIIQCADENDGNMPPTIVYSKEGKPLYSWRVWILPYIGERELYEKLKLDEPWDSPHNKPLLAKTPEIYKMPGVKMEEGTTFFQVFEGSGTLTSNKQRVRYPNSFVNGTSQTILIIEGANAVNWAAPGDIPYSEPVSPLTQIGRHLGPFTLCVMASAEIRPIEAVEESRLRRAILRDPPKDPWEGEGDW